MRKGFVICEITEKSDTFYGDWDRGRPIEYFETRKEAYEYVKENTGKPFKYEGAGYDGYEVYKEVEKYSYTDLSTGKEYAINDKGKWFKA